jgi:hypothetical protein
LALSNQQFRDGHHIVEGRACLWSSHATDGPSWMETIMSKTNETSKFDHANLDNRVLADSELDAVSGAAIYMRSDGIDGQVTTQGFDRWIELTSFQFGVK